jgi:uncharacterized protein
LIIYRNTKAGFLQDTFTRVIEDVVLESYRQATGRSVAASEIRAWSSSLVSMARVLYHADIPDNAGVAIEYSIPQTAKRIDFLISGRTGSGTNAMVLVELKQWADAAKTNKDAVVKSRFSHGNTETSHPSYQAWSYVALMNSFNEAVYEGGIQIQPCAYLHNYPTHGVPLNDSFYSRHFERAPLFFKGEGEQARLREFIGGHLHAGDDGQSLVLLENGRIRPSKSLADALEGLIAGREEFVLIDDQKVVFEDAMDLAGRAQAEGKQVLIVEGGPGTGKTVVAVNLLVAATAARMMSKYVTKNAAPRDVYQSKLTQTMSKTAFSHLFTGSGSFTTTRPDTFDLLIVDEAHRLNEKSGLYANQGENQIKELIQSARCTVFFVDDAQQVTLKDIGDKASIKMWGESLGAKVTQTSLQSQFRCNGSDGYLAWLDHALGIRQTANEQFDQGSFDFRVVGSPDELEALVRQKNQESNRARMVAGYCWPWLSKKRPEAYDISFPGQNFKARWNLSKDGGLWIVSPESINEVGCIHTCQGLELDYVGVIIGPDMVLRDGKVVTDASQRASSDRSVHGWRQLTATGHEGATRVDAIVRNTYRTLMTRGMKGCYVYCTDEELSAFFRRSLESPRSPETGKA